MAVPDGYILVRTFMLTVLCSVLCQAARAEAAAPLSCRGPNSNKNGADCFGAAHLLTIDPPSR